MSDWKCIQIGKYTQAWLPSSADSLPILLIPILKTQENVNNETMHG